MSSVNQTAVVELYKLQITTIRKIILGLVILSIITIVWSSYSIINNPYTYPSRFWLYFMIGLVFYITTLMILSITNVEFVNTIQYIIMVFSLLFNVSILINVYTRYLEIPNNLITIIVLLNGFMFGFIINYLLTFKMSNFYKQINIPTPMSTPSQTPSQTTTKTPLPIALTQSRFLPDDLYDFGAFTPPTSVRSAQDDYFTDYEAQMRDELGEINDEDYYDDELAVVADGGEDEEEDGEEDDEDEFLEYPEY